MHIIETAHWRMCIIQCMIDSLSFYWYMFSLSCFRRGIIEASYINCIANNGNITLYAKSFIWVFSCHRHRHVQCIPRHRQTVRGLFWYFVSIHFRITPLAPKIWRVLMNLLYHLCKAVCQLLSVLIGCYSPRVDLTVKWFFMWGHSWRLCLPNFGNLYVHGEPALRGSIVLTVKMFHLILYDSVVDFRFILIEDQNVHVDHYLWLHIWHITQFGIRII